MENTTKGYHQLLVHQKADELAYEVYKVTREYPKEEILGITSQMRRAATSVPANIAEGYTRSSRMEKVRYLNIAQGSLVELEYFIEFSGKLGYINQETVMRLLSLKGTTGKLLHGFTKALNKTNDRRSQIAGR